MTTISITFLVCLSEARGFVSRNRSNRSNRSFENEMNNIKNIKDVENIAFESCTKYLVTVDKPTKSIQIEYELLPRYVYNVEVLFWGPIVKIITKDGIKSMSTITKLKHLWLTFTIEHKLVLDINELMLLKAHSINFNMQVERTSYSNSVVPDQTNFFFLIEDIDLKCLFIEAFEYIPNNDFDGKSKAEIDVKIILRDILLFAFRGEVTGAVKIPGISYRKKILNMINSFAANMDYKCYNSDLGNYVNAADLLKTIPRRKSFHRKNSFRKASTRRFTVYESNNFDLAVPAEVLFTDPKMVTYKFGRKTMDMKCGYIIINVENLISPIQKNFLYPVVIKLDKLISVPVDILTNNRFEYVYLTYNIFDLSCTSVAKPIENIIHFQYNKIYFLEKRAQAFATLLQKDHFIVQVHGIRKHIITDTTAGIFGSHPLDEFISTPLRDRKVIDRFNRRESEYIYESALFAVACFKLSMLMTPFKTFSQTEFCIHPNRCPTQFSKDIEQFTNIFTINSVNIDSSSSPVYPVSEDVLLSSELCLNVEMEVGGPIIKLLEGMIQKEMYYNRIILITGHIELTKYILTNVFTHNSCWIYKDDIVPPNYLPNFESNTDINNVNVISGFSIDNGDIYIMYLEGNSKWIRSVLWQHIKNEIFSCARILYNSDHVYRERVYTNLIPYGGICNITMHTSLKRMLGSSKIFSPGYLPEPCRRAFQKIDMILKSKSTNEITLNMLPTARELLSLDIEWGVPIYWPITKEKQNE